MKINAGQNNGKLMAVRQGDALYLRSGERSVQLWENGHVQAGSTPPLENVLRDNSDAVGIYEGDSVTLTF
jgi:hypothetical protein